MKRDWFDLLEDYQAQPLDLDEENPYSSSRIREMTMKRMTDKKTKRRRLPVRLLTAAAVAAVLTVSALAVSRVLGAGEMFQDYFTDDAQPLTSAQLEAVDQMGATFEGGVTSNGATITPVAILADRQFCYLRLHIQAPEGVVLPDYTEEEGYYQLFSPEQEHFLSLKAADGTKLDYTSSLDVLPDDDPTDNEKDLVLWLASDPDGTVFNGDQPLYLTLHGLWLQTPDKDYTSIFEGEFVLDLGLCGRGTSLELDVAGMTWTNETYDFTITLEEMTLTPLSLTARYTATQSNDPRIWPGVGPMEVVLKDGSTVSALNKGAPDMNGCAVQVFDTPLDLEQVAYVRCGGYQIQLPPF
ncbi:hypothetical protein [Flavonifractor sp. An112]|uniref:hypothetical protein n=1 Tax=Flavonifractor sp. An112 TaxID=1965544 RepID=UPI00174D458F|nr:hypothetical protein [Flavonifractor sp. An112]